MHKRECKRKGQVQRVIVSFFIKPNWVGGSGPPLCSPYRSTCISVDSVPGADFWVQEAARLGVIW